MHDVTALTQMAFILAAAFSGGLLLQRLRQPAMVGYILVGVLLGPHCLGLIKDGEEIRLLSELGILLLLFIVGLELDLHRFVPIYKIAIGTATVQIATSLFAMFGLSLIFDWPIAMVVLLGFAISLSSTAVAIRLLDDMKALNTPIGNVAVGVLIAQDLAVVPMILIISALGVSSQGGEGGFILQMMMPVLLVMATGGLIWLLLKRPAWFLRVFAMPLARIKAYLDRDRQKPLTALMFCFAAAALSGGLGFSAAYGAFIAGLVLGNSQYGHSYERQVRPLFDILMMFFFLSVGMLIDFHYLADHIIAVILLVLVVMLLKTVVNFGILRAYGLSKRHAIFIGASLGQVGEFSFALAGLGLASGAIDAEVYKMVVVIVAMSLIATPGWLYVMRRLRLIMQQFNPKKRHWIAGTR